MDELELVKVCDWWDCCDDAEGLYYTDPDEAIEAFLDNLGVEDWPEVVEVYGWSRIKLPPDLLDDATLEHTLEWLDEQGYGDPDDYTQPTKKMKEAERVFNRVVLEEYSVWHCEVVGSITVNTAEWVRTYNPHWIAEDEDVAVWVESHKEVVDADTDEEIGSG